MPTAAKSAAKSLRPRLRQKQRLRLRLRLKLATCGQRNANWLTQFLGDFYVQWTFLLLALALALSLSLTLSLSLVVGFLVINAFGFGQVKWQRGSRHEAAFPWSSSSSIFCLFTYLHLYCPGLWLFRSLFSPLSLSRSEECTHKKNLITAKKKWVFIY